MNRVVTIMALAGATLVGTQALASDFTDQPTVSKRQMIAQMVDCMRKRMSANKSSSYNEAKKTCKDQGKKDSGTLPAGAMVASDTAAKP